ncbi:unnamed protein product [Medioppia subpectinata]|uniref:Monocarboxylate transporter 12 n=1 Tax=Medioppia subpectinata TaxID=1979941 RepID=A0A7R9PV73_9ACAR|nr:unnamed protein product [Medioppia subpectinata]CAG2102360.1 unnamed protein product [Medioppia subpectinata]
MCRTSESNQLNHIYVNNNNQKTNESSNRSSRLSWSDSTNNTANQTNYKPNSCQNPLRRAHSSSGGGSAAPDGGWGWVVVFASFMINLISDGVSLSFGIIFMELVDYFGESKSKTSWVGSLFLSIPLITGPIASALTDHFGCRRVAMCGSLMSATGFIAGHFATRLEHLFVAFSFAGLGLALCYVTSIVSVAYYFERRRSLATGLAVCGSGFGTFLFAPLTIFLLKEYDWRGTLLILGAIFLNIANFGALMRDIEPNSGHNNNNTAANNADTSAADLEKADKTCDNSDPNAPLAYNKTINKFYSEDHQTREESLELMSAANGGRLCSSLIHIPTYIRQTDGSTPNVSHEVITELSLKKGGYLRRLLQRHPKLVAFFMPQEYQNHGLDLNASKTLVTNQLAFIGQPLPLPLAPPLLSSSSSPITSQAKNLRFETISSPISNNNNNSSKNIYNSNKNLNNCVNSSKRDSVIDSNVLLKNNCPAIGAELSPLSSNMLRNLRLQRGSLTYRSAMLNIKKYRLRASSAPDIYRNSMVAIHQKSGFLYDLKDVFIDMIDVSNFKNVPYVYLPDQAIRSGAADSESASFLISIIGILNTLGVVLVGYFGDKHWVDPTLLYSCFIAISGLSLSVLPWVHNYWGMACVAALYGFTISANYALVSVILVNLISLDLFTNAYGMLLLVQGFGSLVGPPIAGWLFDLYGNYNITFHLTGICVFISGALVVAIGRSSKCVTIDDDSTQVTESSSRPNSPQFEDSVHSMSETQHNSHKTSLDVPKNRPLIAIDNGFNPPKKALLSSSKSLII